MVTDNLTKCTIIDINPSDGCSRYDVIRSSSDQPGLRVTRTLHAGLQVTMAIALPDTRHRGHAEPPVAMGPGQGGAPWSIIHWHTILHLMTLSVDPIKRWHCASHFNKLWTLPSSLIQLIILITDLTILDPHSMSDVKRSHQAASIIGDDGMDQIVRRQTVDHSVAVMIWLYTISV